MTWYEMVFVALLLLAMIVGGRRGFFSSLLRTMKFIAAPVLFYLWAFPVARSIIESLDLTGYMEMALREVISPVSGDFAEQFNTYLQQVSISQPSDSIIQEALIIEEITKAGMGSAQIIELLGETLAFVFALHAAFLLLFFVAFLGEKVVILIMETIFRKKRQPYVFSRILGGILTAGHMVIFLFFILMLIQPVFDFFLLEFPDYLNPYEYIQSWQEPFRPWLVEQIRNFILEG